MISRLCSRLLAVLLLAGLAFPQDISVPVDIQYRLLLKILAFDRAFKSRFPGEIVIGVAYQKDNRESMFIRDLWIQAMEMKTDQTAAGLPVRRMEIEVSDEKRFLDTLTRLDIDVLYLAPIRAVDIQEVSRLCRARRIRTLTGVPEYVERGIAVGFELRGQNPAIVVNLEAARAEGSDFSSRLLGLARVIERTL